MSFASLLQTHHALPETSLAYLQQAADLVELTKGTILFTDNRLSQDVYFMQRGLARAYVQQDQQEVTFWFGAEGSVLLSIQGSLSPKT